MTGLNLSTYYYTDRRITYLIILLLSLTITIFTFYNYSSYKLVMGVKKSSSAEVSAVRDEITILKRQIAENMSADDMKKDSPDMESLSNKVERINAILERKSFSWSEFLYSLEEASPRGLSITRIKPSYESKKVRISGIAKKLGYVTAFVDNLRDTTYIKKSFLLNQAAQLIDQKHPVISFEIESEGKF